MTEPQAFDPTHALDGWRVPAPAPAARLGSTEIEADRALVGGRMPQHDGDLHPAPIGTGDDRRGGAKRRRA